MIQTNSINPQNSLILAFSRQLLLQPQPLATTDLFSLPVVLPFPECQINGIIRYVAFGSGSLELAKSQSHRSFSLIVE